MIAPAEIRTPLLSPKPVMDLRIDDIDLVGRALGQKAVSGMEPEAVWEWWATTHTIHVKSQYSLFFSQSRFGGDKLKRTLKLTHGNETVDLTQFGVEIYPERVILSGKMADGLHTYELGPHDFQHCKPQERKSTIRIGALVRS